MTRAAWMAFCACMQLLADPAARDKAVRRYVAQAIEPLAA